MSYSQALELTMSMSRKCRQLPISDDELREAFFRAQADGLISAADAFEQHAVVRERMKAMGPVAHEALTQGETFYWGPAPLAVIFNTSKTMPAWRLTHEALPMQAGTFWMCQPLPLQGKGVMSVCGLAGVSWIVPPENAETLMLVAYVSMNSRVVPLSLDFWRFGQTINEAAMSQGDDDQTLGYMRYFACMLAFLEQRILVTSEQRAERHTRKRLATEGFTHEPLIRVVELRRKQAKSDHSGDSEPVDWSHQWIVSGHWRQQWYPSLNAYQPRWIMPYVKGPEDKPLKPPRAKVFAVVR